MNAAIRQTGGRFGFSAPILVLFAPALLRDSRAIGACDQLVLASSIVTRMPESTIAVDYAGPGIRHRRSLLREDRRRAGPLAFVLRRVSTLFRREV